MHLIESVILPIDLYDDVVVKKNGTDIINLRYTNRSGLYDNDTALKAARIIKDEYRTEGVDIEILKRIPERAGLGGSSADAAAVARCMASIFYLDVDPKILLKVGSDVPAMFIDKPCVVGGKGEDVTVINNVKYPNVVLLLIEGGVDTALCYARYDEIGGEGGEIKDVVDAIISGRNFTPHNALTDAAISLNNAIGEGLSILKEYFSCGMTGSGSAIFGIEYDDAEFARKLDLLKERVGERYEIITLSKER